MNSVVKDSQQTQEIIVDENISCGQCGEHVMAHEHHHDAAESWMACGLSCTNGACFSSCVHEWGHSGAHLCKNGHHW